MCIQSLSDITAPTRQELGDLLVALAGGGRARQARLGCQHLLVRLKVMSLQRWGNKLRTM